MKFALFRARKEIIAIPKGKAGRSDGGKQGGLGIIYDG